MKALSKVFRGKFIDALTQAREEGRLHHAQTDAAGHWKTLLTDLRRHDWAVYAKQPLDGPAKVLDYLSRYSHRVAISNERIVGMPMQAISASNGFRQKASSAVFCCMLCPAGSSASGITDYCRRATSKRSWRHAGKRLRCRYQIKR